MTIEAQFEDRWESATGLTLPEVRQDSFRGSCRPLKGLQDTFNSAPWVSADRPLFELRQGWVLATDDEFQWVVYRRQGKRWEAVRFHCEKGGLLRTIKEKIEGVFPEALAEIQSWKLRTLAIRLPERTIKIEGSFKEWLQQHKEKQ